MDVQELLQIKVKITDKAALERLEPAMVAGYLTRHGWKLKETDPRCTIWWNHMENVPDLMADAWLLVPANREVGDYGLRLSEVVRNVAMVEQRAELAVYVDMLEGN